MTAVTTREALARALTEHPPTETEYGPLYCKPCSEAIGDWVRWTPEHVTGALIASGAVIDVATLADDKALVEAIAADQKEAADSWGDPLPGSERTLRARTALRALTAALAERAR